MRFDKAVVKVLEKLNESPTKEFIPLLRVVQIKIGKNDIHEVLNYLSHKKFITRDGMLATKINPDGIEFLYKHKEQENQKEFNKIVALTGSIVALATVYSFLKELKVISEETFELTLGFIILMIFSLVPLAMFAIKSIFGLDE